LFAKFHARLAAVGEGDARGFQHSHDRSDGGMTAPYSSLAALHALDGRHAISDFLLTKANQGAGGRFLTLIQGVARWL
jgi:hypothetical protein